MTTRRSRAPLAVAAAMLAAGCASTVQQSTVSTTSAQPGPGPAGVVGGKASTSSSSPGGGAGGAGGLAGPTPTGPGGIRGGSSTTAGGGPAPHTDAGTTASGPGVTATKIYVGISYSTNADALNQAAGVTNAAVGDEKGYGNAVIDDINRHGGIAGRRVVPVWHDYDGTSTDTSAVQEQAACADYTQDHHVFAVLELGDDAFNTCVTRTGAVIVDDNV